MRAGVASAFTRGCARWQSARRKILCDDCNSRASAAEQAAEKTKHRHSEALFAEESLLLLCLNPGEIPRSARNDTGKRVFPRSVKPLKPHWFYCVSVVAKATTHKNPGVERSRRL